MRDIRQDLSDHLRVAKEEREKLLNQVKALDEKIGAFKVLLRAESANAEEAEFLIAGTSEFDVLPAPADFILGKLKDGKPWSVKVLRDEMVKTGYFKGKKSPGRSVMGALMALSKRGDIKKAGDNWVITKKAPQ